MEQVILSALCIVLFMTSSEASQLDNARKSGDISVHDDQHIPILLAQAQSDDRQTLKHHTTKKIKTAGKKVLGRVGSPLSMDRPIFKFDPNAENKLSQIRAGRVPYNEEMMKKQIADLERTNKKNVFFSAEKYFVSCLAVIITDNSRFLISPTSNSIATKNDGSKILSIVRSGNDRLLITTEMNSSLVEINDIDRTDKEIQGALEVLVKSRLPNPAILVIHSKAFESEFFNNRITQVIHDTSRNLPGFNVSEGNFLIGTRVPSYMLGEAGKKVSMYEYLKGYMRADYIRLSDLVVLGEKNTSRDYYDPAGKPRYYFINTSNSAPVEFGPSDIGDIASSHVSATGGIYTVTLTTKKDVTIVFGGLSAVNPEFMKSDKRDWNTVIGLSSPNGFTIAVECKNGQNLIRMSGDDVRKNNGNIQERLPAGVVGMIKVAVPSIESLAAALKDSDPYIRSAAAHALGEKKDVRAVELLVEALKDREEMVCEAAAQALAEIANRSAVEPLLDLLHDKSTKRVKRDSSSDEQKRARELGTDGRKFYGNARETAAWALGKIGDLRAVEPLIKVLENDYSMIKPVANALAELGDTRAIKPLSLKMKNTSSENREFIIAALKKLKYRPEIPAEKAEYLVASRKWDEVVTMGGTAVAPLISAMNEFGTSERDEALNCLEKIGEPAVTLLIEEIKKKHGGENAGIALVKIGSSSIDPLIVTLKNADPDVRTQAAYLLGQLKAPRAIEPLINSLKDESSAVRSSAANALGTIKDARSVEPLIALLSDKDSVVRGDAAEALGKINDCRAIIPLNALIEDKDTVTRRKAVISLGKLKDERVVKPLINLLRDEDWHVHDEAADILVRIGSASVEPVITAMSGKEAPDFENHCVYILRNIGNPSVKPLISALKNNELDVRRYAAEALAGINDKRAAKPFLYALKEKQLEIISGAYSFFIRKGVPGSETFLIDALSKYGNMGMAQDFLNSGNKKLKQAGTHWAIKHNCSIMEQYGSSQGPIWGGF